MQKLLCYFTNLRALGKRKFPKLTSETEVSFVNEATGLNPSNKKRQKNFV
jgi:hypothetical protein